MPWYPGMEQIYREFLSPKIIYALGKTIVIQAELAQLHPGLVQSFSGDTVTASLLIRSRLQTQAKHWVSDTPAQVVTPSATGGKKKR